MRLVRILLCAAFLASACGGSDDDETWTREANRLCTALERDLVAVDPPREIEEPDELAGFVAGTAERVAAWIERMRALEPPEGAAAEAVRMLDLYGRAVTTTERAAEVLAAGDEGRYQELLREADRLSARGDDLARELGVERCAFPLSG
ncbi:MAG TPA: hypothetical protein VHF23_06320 [Gaiellaceae bacterium]|nr:hypothetical protein [Gaiellaceae bacterium]